MIGYVKTWYLLIVVIASFKIIITKNCGIFQVYEMFVAGYEFYVLSPIFTCHWGLQVKKGRPPWREHQNNQNRKLFDNFKKEIFARYNKDPLNMIKH